MRLRLVVGIVGCAIFAFLPVDAEESSGWEKMTSFSPNKKFAMRIVCHSEPSDPEHIDSDSIKRLEIVSLPEKTVVGSLSPGGYGSFGLIWASDSKWCAFHSSSGPRERETNVYRWQKDKFVQLDTGEMSVDVSGDVRNQYIEPVRWLKPGTLVLEQFTILRGGGDSNIQFTVRFDESGKFQVIGKKKTR
jgi:hypothetical protein